MHGDIYICEIHAVGDSDCHEFSVPTELGEIEGFLVRWHGRWFAYRNSCPHTGVSLNWQPHQFFDYEQRLLQCALHGARFEPDTGRCVYGPCLGEYLQRLPVLCAGTSLYLRSEDFTARGAPDRSKPG